MSDPRIESLEAEIAVHVADLAVAAQDEKKGLRDLITASRNTLNLLLQQQQQQQPGKHFIVLFLFLLIILKPWAEDT